MMIETHAPLTDHDLFFLCDLVERAGARAAEMHATAAVHKKEKPNDFVTDADLELSETIVAALRSRFPNDLVVSEEDKDAQQNRDPEKRHWYIDPIDGTDNYIAGDGHWAVMIGLTHRERSLFGCVYVPFKNYTLCGSPEMGLWKKHTGKELEKVTPKKHPRLETDSPVRMLMGSRDLRRYSWVQQMPDVTCIKRGSVGLKVASIVDEDADIFMSLSGKLKVWDTSGPLSIALAAGLEVGTMDGDEITYPNDRIHHNTAVIVGRPGALEWVREHVAHRQDLEVPARK